MYAIMHTMTTPENKQLAQPSAELNAPLIGPTAFGLMGAGEVAAAAPLAREAALHGKEIVTETAVLAGSLAIEGAVRAKEAAGKAASRTKEAAGELAVATPIAMVGLRKAILRIRGVAKPKDVDDIWSVEKEEGKRSELAKATWQNDPWIGPNDPRWKTSRQSRKSARKVGEIKCKAFKKAD
jgi:hypothetical protein